MDGVSVIQDKKYTVVSQLSLVDLAGSERAGKAKTTGQRLQEAGLLFLLVQYYVVIIYVFSFLVLNVYLFHRRNK